MQAVDTLCRESPHREEVLGLCISQVVGPNKRTYQMPPHLRAFVQSSHPRYGSTLRLAPVGNTERSHAALGIQRQ